MSTCAAPIPLVLLNAGQVGQRYGVGRSTVERWSRESRMPRPYKIGSGIRGTKRWKIDDLVEWEDSGFGTKAGEASMP